MVNEIGIYAIYRVFGNNETLLYIGKTERSFLNRINEHTKEWLHLYRGQLYVRFGVLSFEPGKKFSSKKLNDVESLLITYCKPPENTSNYKYYSGRENIKIVNNGRFGMISKIISTDMLEWC
ncbi:GIY-YIG nuclease family protein [Tepidanaerobacter sp. GT38]|nr:GIY-YIG nuclease family protein [Tepidanaerobacter sp. GT38]